MIGLRVSDTGAAISRGQANRHRGRPPRGVHQSPPRLRALFANHRKSAPERSIVDTGTTFRPPAHDDTYSRPSLTAAQPSRVCWCVQFVRGHKQGIPSSSQRLSCTRVWAPRSEAPATTQVPKLRRAPILCPAVFIGCFPMTNAPQKNPPR